MYIDNISSQLQVFLYSIGFGFILGSVYDFFRIYRAMTTKKNKSIPVQDILFFLICSIITFMFLLVVNNGKFRLNIFVAMVTGFSVYYLTVGRFSINIIVLASKRIKIIINTISMIIIAPFRAITNLFGKIYLKCAYIFKNINISVKNC